MSIYSSCQSARQEDEKCGISLVVELLQESEHCESSGKQERMHEPLCSFSWNRAQEKLSKSVTLRTTQLDLQLLELLRPHLAMLAGGLKSTLPCLLPGPTEFWIISIL